MAAVRVRDVFGAWRLAHEVGPGIQNNSTEELAELLDGAGGAAGQNTGSSTSTSVVPLSHPAASKAAIEADPTRKALRVIGRLPKLGRRASCVGYRWPSY